MYSRREDRLKAQRRFYRFNPGARDKAVERKRRYRARNVAILGEMYEVHCNAIFRVAWRPVSAAQLLGAITEHSCGKCRRWRIGG